MSSLICEWVRVCRVLTWLWSFGISLLVCEWGIVCCVLNWRWILGMSSIGQLVYMSASYPYFAVVFTKKMCDTVFREKVYTDIF